MNIYEQATGAGRKIRPSLDGRAVTVARFLTALVRLGVLKWGCDVEEKSNGRS